MSTYYSLNVTLHCLHPYIALLKQPSYIGLTLYLDKAKIAVRTSCILILLTLKKKKNQNTVTIAPILTEFQEPRQFAHCNKKRLPKTVIIYLLIYSGAVNILKLGLIKKQFVQQRASKISCKPTIA